jgi:hypothetical protein
MVRIWGEALYYHTPDALNGAKARSSIAHVCSNMYIICTSNTQFSCTTLHATSTLSRLLASCLAWPLLT